MKSKVCVSIFFFTFLSDSLYWFCLYEIFTFPESALFMKKNPRFIVNKKEAVTFSVKCINQ